eukprot:TRINITY_DN5719_c0_g1_i2.p1 TRINITY_DN5719_c0_g1~~TRINITY_DN5719_c0_g1_i2.p1  ORF type:complete len:425 (+),score=41.98 TRINITY_DN5719_c0_g1_i2:81-1355(+)
MRSAAAVVRGAQRRLFATFSVASADRPPVSALYANLRPLGLPELSAAADASAQGKHSAAYASLCRAGDILLPMAGSSAQLRQAGAAIWVLQCAETAWSPRPRTGVPADLPLKEAAEAAAADPDNGELATCFAWAAAVLLPLSGHGAPSAPAPPPGCSPAITAALQALAAARGGGGAGQAAEGGSLVQRLASAEAAEAQGVPPESVDPELGAAALAAAALAPDAGPELRCLAALHGGRRACAAAVGEQGGIWCEHYSGGAASATERLLAPHELPPLCMGGESPGDKVEAAALSSDKDAVRDSCSAVFKPLTECLTLCQEQLAGLRLRGSAPLSGECRVIATGRRRAGALAAAAGALPEAAVRALRTQAGLRFRHWSLQQAAYGVRRSALWHERRPSAGHPASPAAPTCGQTGEGACQPHAAACRR